LSIRRHLPNSPFYTAALTAHTIAAFDAGLKAFEAAPGPTVYAEPDFIAQASGAPVIPNDADFTQLWNLHNTGQTGGVVGADVKAAEAWNTTTGSSDVIVGVIDTGIDYNHPDLAANVWANTAEIAANGLDDDGDGYVDDIRGWNFVAGNNNPLDDNGHGSHTSGTLGAVGGNAVGVTGVCQHVKIMPLKFLSATGSGSNTDAIEAILYATAHHALLTSNSWGGGGFSQAMKDAIDLANLADVGFIAAAGNSANDNDQVPSYPSSFQSPNVIAVAATDASDALTYFSSYGKTSVHIAAPGLSIYSTTKDGGYATMSGTSMATPHVSGACALLKAANPNLTFAQIKQSLLTQADAKPTLVNKTTTGGRLNVEKALVPATTPFVVMGDVVIDDALSGNGDGILSPDEGGLIRIQLRNIGALTSHGVRASIALKTDNPLVSYTHSSRSFGDIAPDATATTSSPFLVYVDPEIPTPTDLAFTVTVTDTDSHTWTLDLTLHVYTISTLSGRVTRLTGGGAVEGATIDIKGTVNTTTVTAADGTYSIPLVNGTYKVIAKAAGLNPSPSRTVTLPPSQASADFVLGHSDVLVSTTALNATLPEDHTATQTFTITNNGDLPLTYTVQEAPDNTFSAAVRNRPTPASWLQTPLFAHAPRKPQEGFPSLIPAPSISASAAAQSLLHTLPFNDGFEVGDWSENWYETNGPDNIREIVSNEHVQGSKSLHLQNVGPDDGHFTGVHGEFDYFVSPGYISFWVKPGADDMASSYVVLTDVYFVWLFDWAWFFANDNGRFYINADVGGNQAFAYTPNTWYHVELRNINWNTHTFDYFVDDALVQAGVPMRNPDYCYGLAYAIIYNYSAGVDAWWDDIKVYADALNWLTVSNRTGTIAPGQTQTLTVTYNANGLNAGTYHGNLVLTTNAALDPNETIPVTMTVTPNVPPVADSQTIQLNEDTLKLVTLSGTDADSTALTARISSLPVNGELFQTSDGVTPGALITASNGHVTDPQWRVLFRPFSNKNGTPCTSFQFVLRDTRNDSTPATVTLNVSPVDDPPVALEDQLSLTPVQAVTPLAVMANDIDYDGDVLSIVSVTDGQHGTVLANPDGTVSYTPDVGFVSGNDAFTYTITDGTSNASATVHVSMGRFMGGSWPTFGHDTGRTGHYPASKGPLRLGQRWVRNLGTGVNHAIAGEGMIFATVKGAGNAGEAVALSASNGQTVWSRPVTANVAINPPSVASGSLVFRCVNSSVDTTVVSLVGNTGGLKWSNTSAQSLASTTFRSPLITHDSVFAGGGQASGLSGLKLADGGKLFQQPLAEENNWTPTFAGSAILTCTGATLRGHDPVHGGVMWSMKPNAADAGGAATVAYGGGHAFFVMNGHLDAVQIVDDQPVFLWEKSDASFVGTPAVSMGKVYAITSAPDSVRVYAAHTGELLATLPLSSAATGQPVLCEDSLIVSGVSKTELFSLTDNTLVQSLAVGGSLTLADGTLLFTDNIAGTVRAFVQAPDVTFSSAAANSVAPINVTFDSPMPDAVIHFTTDGTTPTVASRSLPSGGSLMLVRSVPLKAVATIGGETGNVTEASFTITDTDASGLPDWWQQQYLAGLGNSPTADGDHDGRSNLEEFIAGTDPGTSDRFETSAATDPEHPGQTTLSWASVIGRFYVVEASTDLAVWSPASSMMAGTGNVMTWSESAAGTHKFYRVKVSLP
jgi:subtilisin family serine protease